MSAALLPETVALQKRVLGHRRTVWPLNRDVTPDAVRRFALGVGDDNPIWWGEGAYAPPTFLYTGVNFGMWPDLGGGPERKPQPLTTLWAGDQWSWDRRLEMGERFEASSQIIDVSEKTGADGHPEAIRQRERIAFTDESGIEFARFIRTTAVVPRRAPSTAPEPPKLSRDQLEKVAACYEAEVGRRRGAQPRSWRSVCVGDRLGPVVKGPLSVTSIVGFAMGWGAPLCPTNRILHQFTSRYPDLTVVNARTGWPESTEGMHWDPDVYGAMGFSRGFDFGPQRISWAAHLCTDWCGDAGELVELNVRLLKPNFIGDVTWFSGEVTGVGEHPDGRGRIEVRLEGRNQHDELTTAGAAAVLLPN